MSQDGTIVGKHILVGLAYMDRHGEVRQKVQTHGTITRIEKDILYLDRADGAGEFSVPFEGEPRRADPEAVFTLASTGEEVTNIDYVSTWEIHPPKEEAEPGAVEENGGQ